MPQRNDPHIKIFYDSNAIQPNIQITYKGPELCTSDIVATLCMLFSDISL
jgi:hypothetical protein